MCLGVELEEDAELETRTVLYIGGPLSTSQAQVVSTSGFSFLQSAGGGTEWRIYAMSDIFPLKNLLIPT